MIDYEVIHRKIGPLDTEIEADIIERCREKYGISVVSDSMGAVYFCIVWLRNYASKKDAKRLVGVGHPKLSKTAHSVVQRG